MLPSLHPHTCEIEILVCKAEHGCNPFSVVVWFVL